MTRPQFHRLAERARKALRLAIDGRPAEAPVKPIPLEASPAA